MAIFSMSATIGCGGTEQTTDKKTEDEKADAWDAANAPELFGIQTMRLVDIQEEAALSGFLSEKPWADTYWPLNQKGMANRWMSGEYFDSFEEQKSSAQEILSAADYSLEDSVALSPAEKYDFIMRDFTFGMTREGWAVYEEYQDYEGNWGWMGHCHGWAPAAYIERAPKASVVVEEDGKRVLFSEGDIRGLLTKAYAANQTDGGTRFIGTRCNARTIIKDDLGRIVDGTLFEKQNGNNADQSTSQTIYIDRNFWSEHYLLTYTESVDSGSVKVLQATAYADSPEGALVVNVWASIDDYQNDIVEKEAIFVYNKECRDTNAASFHLVLVSYLSDLNADDEKQGFVLDVTREDQVWNQPVYGFESRITSVENVADMDDPLADFRADGTTQIAHVESEVYYGLEKGPYVHYTPENSSYIRSKTFRYTLEIDEDGVIIGGEWDRWSSAPDFLWALQGRLNDSELINYSVVSAIHQCSLDIDAATTMRVDGMELQVVDGCEL
jgi:hypothetical protein